MLHNTFYQNARISYNLKNTKHHWGCILNTTLHLILLLSWNLFFHLQFLSSRPWNMVLPSLLFLLTREREREAQRIDEVIWHGRFRETAWYGWMEREYILVSWDRLCHSEHRSHRRRSYISFSAIYPHNTTTLVGRIKEDWGEYYLFLLVWRWSVWSF